MSKLAKNTLDKIFSIIIISIISSSLDFPNAYAIPYWFWPTTPSQPVDRPSTQYQIPVVDRTPSEPQLETQWVTTRTQSFSRPWLQSRSRLNSQPQSFSGSQSAAQVPTPYSDSPTVPSQGWNLANENNGWNQIIYPMVYSYPSVPSLLSVASQNPGNVVNEPKRTREQLELIAKQNELRRDIIQRRELIKYRTGNFYAPERLVMRVRRESILTDSYRQLAWVRNIELTAPALTVIFVGEMGLDRGGLSKEWFLLLSKLIFKPSMEIFTNIDQENGFLQINPKPVYYNSMYQFVGNIFGMALYHRYLLNASLIKPFYKQILGKPVELEDVESFDPDLYKNLLWTKENNNVSELELTFTWDEEMPDGKIKERELIKGGKDIKVNEDNKEQYIKEVLKWKYVTSVKGPMDAFLYGLSEIIPLRYLERFNEKQLELAICGNPKIDVDDWQNNTKYSGASRVYWSSIVVEWFWEVIRDFDDDMRSRLLEFVTGSSKVPAGGFMDLKHPFTIHLWDSPNSLPVAHTCGNMLDLPLYRSKEQLKEKLVKAIKETSGFHIR